MIFLAVSACAEPELKNVNEEPESVEAPGGFFA